METSGLVLLMSFGKSSAIARTHLLQWISFSIFYAKLINELAFTSIIHINLEIKPEHTTSLYCDKYQQSGDHMNIFRVIEFCLITKVFVALMDIELKLAIVQ